MRKELMWGLFYSMVFGLSAILLTIGSTFFLKPPQAPFWDAWLKAVDAHASFVLAANLFGFYGGWQRSKKT